MFELPLERAASAMRGIADHVQIDLFGQEKTDERDCPLQFLRIRMLDGAMEPFRILGNTWFVGTGPASTHIIDSGEGLIMLDSGYQESLYLVIDSMYSCGLDPKNLRYIIHLHGHIDHAAATRVLVELTGAETFIGEGDLRMVDGAGAENQSARCRLRNPDRSVSRRPARETPG